MISALRLSGITRHFGAVAAVRDVSLDVRAGTVHALLGENGAGKTTLMRIAYGMTAPDAGRIAVMDRDVAFRSPADAIALGVGMVHQHFTLVPAMTVAENLALGERGAYSPRAAAARVQAVSELTGFALDPEALVETLPVGAQQRVEIAKALARDARLLILDEPTGVLAPGEVDELLRWLRAYVARGNAAVLITHKLREALAVADDVTVLRHGRVVATGAASTMTERSLTADMIGSEISVPGPGDTSRPRAVARGAPVLVARGLDVADAHGRLRVRGATFAVRAGEVLGVAAVEGSGQRELLRALAGRLPVSGGELERPEAVGFVPEDRHHDAVMMERSLTENVALRGAGRARGRADWAAMRRRTTELMAAFDVRAPGPATAMRALSGGNQQKLVLARELVGAEATTGPWAIVAENPTRGLDVNATAAVHERLRDAARQGAAVVVHSGDLDEVLALADRVLVVFDGATHEPSTMDRAAIGRAMLGLAGK